MTPKISPSVFLFSVLSAVFSLSLTALFSVQGASAQEASEEIQDESPQGPKPLSSILPWRPIGPAVFGGRIVDIELLKGKANAFLVASATGGLWKTINEGTTWTCLFQNEGTISIGDIAVDPQNSETIWLGSGEANSQRSSNWGDGVYKSDDGGETWKNCGLRDSHHIGRIVVDPSDSNIVYVAALGHLYTTNDERGLYKTLDGGETWSRVLGIDDRTGVVDVVIDPHHPETLYAATYERMRRAWDFDGSGPGSSVYKTQDGGESWTKLQGGLPEGEIGRIGLAIFPEDPNILYAEVSNQNLVSEEGPNEENSDNENSDEDSEESTEKRGGRLGITGKLEASGFRLGEVREGSPAAEAGLKSDDLITSMNGEPITDVLEWIQYLRGLKDGDSIALTYERDGDSTDIEITLTQSNTSRRSALPRRRGQIGGEIYRSEDGGESWTKQNEESIGGSPAYYYGQIRVDPNDDKRIYVLSVPVYGSDDGGKTWNRNVAGSVHVDHHALVIDPNNSDRMILGNDGGLAITYDRGANWDHINNLPISQFYAVGLDNSTPYNIYGGTQDNGTWGGPSMSRTGSIRNHHWYRVGGGDGFYAQIDPQDPNVVYGESQFGSLYRVNRKSAQTHRITPPNDRENPNRFNWSSPILLSSHNPQILYFGGNRLFMSYNRGDTWPVISPDLTTADPKKLEGNVPHCTITTIAESPFDPRILMVGSDDGLVHITKDGGSQWSNLAGLFSNVPPNLWVSRVLLSSHDVNVAYVTFTGYREDDFRPFAFRSQDGGRRWTSIVGDLPSGPINVIREDPRNPNTLYIGTEFGVYASMNAGSTWTPLGTGMPRVPVHDLEVQARDRDLVAATHGRGFYVLDTWFLSEINDESIAKQAHLFSVEPVTQWGRELSQGEPSGSRHFRGENPASGASITYHIAKEIEEEFSLRIVDISGKLWRTLEAPKDLGFHRISWDLSGEAPENEDDQTQPRRRRRGAPTAPPGRYRVELTIGEQTLVESFDVLRDSDE